MKKIIITGVAGFIGSHIAESLLREGVEVIGIDNLNNYYPVKIKNNNLKNLQLYKTFNFIRLDITDEKGVNKIIKDHTPDYLIHCAARAGVRASLENPLIYTKTNIYGSQILLEAIKKYSPKTKSILLSSASVYGVQSKIPFEESMLPNPTSPYGVTKYSMELIARQYFDYYHLPILIIRPFSIYGPGGRPDMAPMLLIKYAEQNKTFIQFGSNCDNQRDWTYIDDFVGGINLIISKYNFKSFEIINLGNNKPVGIDTFIKIEKKLIKRYLNKNLKIVHKGRGPEELPVTFANINKAKRLFGYKPMTTIERGLQKLFEYYVSMN